MLIACSASLVLTRLVRGVAVRVGAVDKPDGRKVHKIAIPRLGGVSVVLAVGLTVLSRLWVRPDARTSSRNLRLDACITRQRHCVCHGILG